MLFPGFNKISRRFNEINYLNEIKRLVIRIEYCNEKINEIPLRFLLDFYLK